MQRFMRTFCGTLSVSLFSVAGCATVLPQELTDARNAYEHASASRAQDLSPSDLFRAKEALMTAQESWASDPNSALTRDLSYVAQRKAQLAEVTAGIALARTATPTAEQSIDGSSQ